MKKAFLFSFAAIFICFNIFAMDKANNELLKPEEIEIQMKKIPSWTLSSDKQQIEKSFKYNSQSAMLMFINAVWFQAEKSKHHPRIAFEYGTCTITYTTNHPNKGLTLKDIEGAVNVDELKK